jgi:hypothetical protein
MPIFVSTDNGYKEVQLIIVEDEMDLPKMDRKVCGLSFAGCAFGDRIYMTGWSGETLWHEIQHHMGVKIHI